MEIEGTSSDFYNVHGGLVLGIKMEVVRFFWSLLKLLNWE